MIEKAKPNEMNKVNWIWFKETWKSWKKLQDPGRDLSTNLLNLVQNAKNEVTNELGGAYDEDKILEKMEEVLVCRVNITEATTNFHSCDKDQRYNKRTDTYVIRLRDAAVDMTYI